MIVTISFLAVYLKVGSRTLLKYAATIKPYAQFYISADWIGTPQVSTQKLVFFFGDSTLQRGFDENHEGTAEMLESELRRTYPDLGKVSVLRKSFGSATLYHFYCMLFLAEKYSPDLVIIPVNWMWLGMKSPGGYFLGKQHLSKIAGVVPMREYFSSNKGNPLRQVGVSPKDKISYMMDIPLLHMTGMRLWIRERLCLPETEGTASTIDWFPMSPPGYAELCPGHQSIDLLRYVAETAEKRNIRVLFYIVPSETMLGDRFPLEPDQFKCSVEQILNASETRTTRGLNFARLLNADQFIDSVHYGASGHRDMARVLAPEVYLELSEKVE